MSKPKEGIWNSSLFSSKVGSANVKPPEMLFGYLIGPFGALLASGIFTSQLQNYLTNVLKLDLGFLTGLQLLSTILIVAANLIVGQLIERTRTIAGKARPWILLSALTLSVTSVLMFIVPFESQTARMVWIAIAYNLYYAVGFPIYNTANSTLVPVSTRNSQQRATLASFTNIASLGVMGVGSMVFPTLVSMALKEDQNLWFMAMLAVAIFTALTIMLQFQFTRERVTEESSGDSSKTMEASISVRSQLKAVISEKMWWLVILFYISFQWSGAMKNGSMTFFCQWVLDNSFFIDLGILESLGDGRYTHGAGRHGSSSLGQSVWQTPDGFCWYDRGRDRRYYCRTGRQQYYPCSHRRGLEMPWLRPSLLPDFGYAGRRDRSH